MRTALGLTVLLLMLTSCSGPSRPEQVGVFVLTTDGWIPLTAEENMWSRGRQKKFPDPSTLPRATTDAVVFVNHVPLNVSSLRWLVSKTEEPDPNFQAGKRLDGTVEAIPLEAGQYEIRVPEFPRGTYCILQSMSRYSSISYCFNAGPERRAAEDVAAATPASPEEVLRLNQRETMASLRSIGKAIEMYSIDNYIYPKVDSIEELLPLITRYETELPTTDSWGNSFWIDSSHAEYMIGSGGKDGGRVAIEEERGATTDPNAGIIFRNGQFTQWPKGLAD